MQQSFVTVSVNGADPVECHAGDLVGRLTSARVCVQDPRLSEAHALISARARAWWLLPLRHPIGGSWRIPLRIGLTVELVRGVDLEVVALEPPTPELCLILDGDRRPLERRHYGLDPRRGAEWLVPDPDPGSVPADVWPSEEAWFWRLAGQPPIEILPTAWDDDRDGAHVRLRIGTCVVRAETSTVSWTATVGDPPRMVIELGAGAATVLVEGRPATVLRGRSYAILRKLRLGGGRAALDEFDKSSLWRLRRDLREAARHAQDPLLRRLVRDGSGRWDAGYELADNYELRGSARAQQLDAVRTAVIDLLRGAATTKDLSRRFGRSEEDVLGWRDAVLAAVQEVELG